MKSNSLRMICMIISLSTMLFMHAAHAQRHLFNKVKKAASDVATAGWKATTAPYQALIATPQAINNGNIQQIYQPYREMFRQSGTGLSSSVAAIYQPNNDLYNKINAFAANVGGPAEFIFDVSTFSDQYLQHLTATGGYAVANVLQGQNPFQITALPLAGAIRSARQRFYSISRPIPDDVKAALRGKLPDATLNRARYAVGKLEITLPNVLNYLNTGLSNTPNHAVTVDDIIVFRYDPGSFASNNCHWTHEMVHVDQYREYGVENFAWRYVNGSKIEEQTNKTATAIQGMACNNGTSGVLGFFGGSSTGQNFQNKELPLLQADIPSEYFVAQCFFKDNTEPVYYFITNTGRIVTVNIYNGVYMPIGNATPALDPNSYAWDFYTSQFRFGVGRDGFIIWQQPRINPYNGMQVYNFGQPVYDYIRIGHVTRII